MTYQDDILNPQLETYYIPAAAEGDVAADPGGNLPLYAVDDGAGHYYFGYKEPDGTFVAFTQGPTAGAPDDATYWTSTSNPFLTNEVNMTSIGNGIIKVTAGTPSIAAAGTDYLSPAAIGVTVQAYDADLTTIAAMNPATPNTFIMANGTNWTQVTAASARTGLGLGTIATQSASGVAITGGNIDGTIIGATTQAAATVTTLTTTSYIEIPEQAAPGTPTNAGRLYFDTSNRFSWIGENGFSRTFDGTGNTASRIYVLPDQAGTMLLATYTGNVTFTGSFLNTGHVGAGATATVTTTSVFNVAETYTTPATGTRAITTNVGMVFTGATANTVEGIRSTITIDTGGFAQTGAFAGFVAGTTLTSSTGTGTATTLIGNNVVMTVGANTTLTTGHGYRVNALTNSGTVTGFAAFVSLAQTTATNNTYILLGQASVASGNWAIYSVTANDSSFAGKIRVGSNTGPSATLDVTGTFAVSSTTTFSGAVTFSDVNMVTGTATGTKFATATNQKMGWWNATPIVQPTTAIAAATFVANAGTAVNDASTFDGYTLGQLVKALRNMGKLA